MGRLDGKVAVITGAGTGIGRACMELFAREGAKIVGAGRTEETLTQALRAAGATGRGLVVRTDVAVEEDCKALIEAALAAFGGIDVVVNNAGVGWQYRESHPHGMDPLETTPAEYWREVIDINLTSVYLVSKFAIPALRERGGGAIVNVSSIGGAQGMLDAHAYSAAKAGMNNLTRSMARTYGAAGIRTNAVMPGLTDTQMVRSYMEEQGNPQLQEETRFAISPLGRAARPEEIAHACLFLAGDESSYVNGAVLPVDGGSSC